MGQDIPALPRSHRTCTKLVPNQITRVCSVYVVPRSDLHSTCSLAPKRRGRTHPTTLSHALVLRTLASSKKHDCILQLYDKSSSRTSVQERFTVQNLSPDTRYFNGKRGIYLAHLHLSRAYTLVQIPNPTYDITSPKGL